MFKSGAGWVRREGRSASLDLLLTRQENEIRASGGRKDRDLDAAQIFQPSDKIFDMPRDTLYALGGVKQEFECTKMEWQYLLTCLVVLIHQVTDVTPASQARGVTIVLTVRIYIGLLCT